ncbi:MAG: Enoyl-CoA hydratase/isomerase [Cyanobacteria bacterium RYN_339]|nr:Enoyl-CoA hydratase/isomerase [Cyanobacteria bacterium RYN_339]
MTRMSDIFTYEDILAEAMAEPRELVTVLRQGARATVTMAEPERMNALTAALMWQLHQRLQELAADPSVRVVVLTGADPAFSAGGDLALIERGARAVHQPEHEQGTLEPWRWIRRQFGGVARLIAGTDKAFIAAINGAAAGVGLAIAMTCDILVASDRAVLVPAFGKLGLVPEVGTSWQLTRRLGYQGAFAFFVGGRHVTAAEALELGLVQEVHPHDQLMAAVDRWCEQIVALPPYTLEMTKPLLRAAADMPWAQSLTMEEFAEANCFSTQTLPRAAAAIKARRS